jgi:hypothetical protein
MDSLFDSFVFWLFISSARVRDLVSIIIEFNKNLISNFASHKMSRMHFKEYTL